MEIGKANYEGSSKKNRFKIKDGNNVYRILPPMGSLAKKGKWSQYFSVVWGYKNADGKNRPFADCRVVNFNTKMVEVESDAFLKSQKIKAAFEDLKARLKAGEKVDPEVLKKTEELKDRYNIENKHYVNVVNLQGEIGLLKLGARAKKLLEGEIKKLTAKGVDPLSLENGRFFNIFREGKSFDTVYQVTEYKETVMMNGQEVDVPKVHKMDDAFISRLKAEAFDLGTLYKMATADQVKAIVDGADPDLVLGLTDSEAEDDSPEDTETPSTSSQDNLALLKAQEEAEAKKLAQAKAEAQAAEKARLAAEAEAKAAKEADALAKTTVEAAGATSQSDEEWLKSMGINV
jgi:hypothetical protein